MNHVAKALAEKRGSEHVCAVCGRESVDAIGVGAGHRVPMVWTCSQRCRIAVLSTYQHLVEDDLGHFERIAREYGGTKGGHYLEQIGKTDLAELTQDQWRTYLHAVFDAYADAMVRQYKRVHAPRETQQGEAA